MYNRRGNQQYTGKQADATENRNQSFNNVFDEWNLNTFYLSEIGYLMSEWRLLNLYGYDNVTVNPEYFDRAIKILDALVDLLAAKISEGEEQEYNQLIRNYDKRSRQIFKTCEDGRTLMDKQLFAELNFKIRKMYRSLLRLLDINGMLTKKQPDPNLAMTDMS